MSRTREWIKFGSLVAVALALAVAFVSVVDFPSRSLAQASSFTSTPAGYAPASVFPDRPAPVEGAEPVQDLGNAFVQVADAVRPAVVFIEARGERQEHPEVPAPFDRYFEAPDQPRRGTGSGFIIAPNGYILTNNHVVEGFDRFEVRLFDDRLFSARVVGRDPNTDVAVIKIDANDLPTASFGDSDALRVGEWVLAIGNPLGRDFSFTVTAGIVSGRGRGLPGLLDPSQRWSIQDFIQTDAAINPGNSGGPLVNVNGQVVGVNSAIASRTGYYSGYSFAIPINLARMVADQLVEHGKVTRAALGVTIQNADVDDAAYVGLDEIRGVRINDFNGDASPAERAGLQPGDVIVAVDGEQIDYVAQLQQMVGFKQPGDVIVVTVMRKGGDRREVSVELGEADTEARPQVARADSDDEGETASFEEKLGLEVETLPTRMTSDSRIGRENQGPVIMQVDPDGPARDKPLREANARQGVLDIITHVEGQRVRNVDELGAALAEVEPGTIVSLRVFQVGLGARIIRLRTAGE
jgi:serine protease Do